MGEIVNKKRLAEMLDVSQKTLTDWQNKGMPIKVRSSRGRSNEYDTADVFNWRVDYMSSGDGVVTSKERLEIATAKLRELELAKEENLFLFREDVEFAIEGIITAARTVLLAGPRKLKKLIKKEYDVEVDLKHLQQPFFACLDKLAEDPEDGEADDEETAEEVEST